MAHTHEVRDDDLVFVIDPETRAITHESGSRITIMQGDHNSEEFIFEIPKIVEGHDMTKCDSVQAHFDNIGVGTSVSTRTTNSGIKELLRTWVSDENTIQIRWLISGEATQLYGTLEFSLKFICYDTDENPGYVWNTDICKLVDVKQSKNNGDAVIERYPDAYQDLNARVKNLEGLENRVDVKLDEFGSDMNSLEKEYDRIVNDVEEITTSDKYVKSVTYAEGQYNELTQTDRDNARLNIGAASQTKFLNLEYDVKDLQTAVGDIETALETILSGVSS